MNISKELDKIKMEINLTILMYKELLYSEIKLFEDIIQGTPTIKGAKGILRQRIKELNKELKKIK